MAMQEEHLIDIALNGENYCWSIHKSIHKWQHYFVAGASIRMCGARMFTPQMIAGSMQMTRFAWQWQDLHAIKLLRAHIGEWTITRMLDYWRVMCFTGYRLNWNPWIWIPFPVDSDCTLLCSQVDRTRYSSIASGNNCIAQLCKCVSLHLKWALWIHPRTRSL
jgi:hypothetical protein